MTSEITAPIDPPATPRLDAPTDFSAHLPSVLGYLGQTGDHYTNLGYLLNSSGIRLCPIPESSTWRSAQPGSIAKATASLPQKILRLRDQLYGIRDDNYANAITEAIDRHTISCVLAYWGTWILGDVATLKRLRPSVKVVLNVMCHPMALSTIKIALQNRYLRRMVRHLDGIIYPSITMRRYLAHAIPQVPCIVSPPYYSAKWFPSRQLDVCAEAPNIVFLGRTDFLRAQPCDNIAHFLDELLGNNIHVFHSRSNHGPSAALLEAHPFRHSFNYQSLAELETYATQFDASLVTYNSAACRRTDRFDNTVPDRLIASVTAGVPVALPRTGYAAAREYLRNYRAVIVFDSAQHLAAQLHRRDRMHLLRRMAQEDCRHYAGEQHLAPLLGFLASVASTSPSPGACRKCESS